MKKLFACLPITTLVALLLIPLLLLIDALCYQITLPVNITVQRGTVTLATGDIHLTAGTSAPVQSLQFVPQDPLEQAYQIDVSDSINNRDLDIAYFRSIASSPYYRLQAWMRDFAGTSRWRDLTVVDRGQILLQKAWPDNGELVALPDTNNLQIHVEVQRLETPMILDLMLHDGNTLQVKFDRDSRLITITEIGPNTIRTVTSAFFPTDIAPFAAMLVDTLARILLWATLLLLTVQLCEITLAWGWTKIRQHKWFRWKIDREPDLQVHESSHEHTIHHLDRQESERPRGESRFRYALSARTTQLWSALPAASKQLARLFQPLHPLAWLALGCSLIYVIWIARVEYNGQPHIYDASAYLFMAKTYASGQLSVPAPPRIALFPGPFTLVLNGRWFGQYEPGTALTLVPGVWLGMPWLVEPLLGTLALLGCGLIATRLYNRQVATLTVILGCLSPFYSYLAASYLSHVIALFYLVWGLWALLRFAQGEAGWNMILCGCCFGMAALTRDLVAVLFIALFIPGIILLTWKKPEKKRWLMKRFKWWLVLIPLALIFSYAYLGYNLLLTGDMLTTPRNLFFAGDTWGFGQGIGFYGQHTLAAGLVNMDELLTSLQIDLFGWPFYLTLAFLALPFLTGRVQKADWFLLGILIITAGSYIGYFYNGIYLGPRYLFEDLPLLLILSTRGILLLSEWGRQSGQTMSRWLHRAKEPAPSVTRPTASLVTLLLVSILIGCNLLYYMPRQIVRYQDYTGLPDLTKLDTSQIYHSPVHDALVVTDNLAIYQMVLFPLNDPDLKGDVIYAWGYTTTQFEELQKAFPRRTLYILVNYPDGSVRYIRLN